MADSERGFGSGEPSTPNYQSTDAIDSGSQAIDFSGKRIVVCGLHGFGKTQFSKVLGLNYKTIVVDIHGEYRPDVFDRWVPQNKTYGDKLDNEMNIFLSSVLEKNQAGYEMLLIDEAEQFFPNGKPLPAFMNKIYGFNRHMKLAYVCITHRPVDINTKLLETAHFVIFFRLTGSNDMKKLREMYPGLDAAVFSLQPYEFIVYECGKGFWKGQPIEIVR